MSVRKESTQKDFLKPFSRDQFSQIIEVVASRESPVNQLLLAVLLTGMRASQCLPIKVEDFEINDDGCATVNGVSVPFMDTLSTLEIVKRKRLSTDGYLFISSADSSAPMSMSELQTKFSEWLKNANISAEGATPHLLRHSVLSAYAAVQKK